MIELMILLTFLFCLAMPNKIGLSWYLKHILSCSRMYHIAVVNHASVSYWMMSLVRAELTPMVRWVFCCLAQALTQENAWVSVMTWAVAQRLRPLPRLSCSQASHHLLSSSSGTALILVPTLSSLNHRVCVCVCVCVCVYACMRSVVSNSLRPCGP